MVQITSWVENAPSGLVTKAATVVSDCNNETLIAECNASISEALRLSINAIKEDVSEEDIDNLSKKICDNAVKALKQKLRAEKAPEIPQRKGWWNS